MKRTKLAIEDFRRELAEWEDELEDEEIAQNTRKAYATAIESFKHFLAETDVETIRKRTLVDYKDFLSAEASRNRSNPDKKAGGIKSNNTINLRLKVINRIFNDLGYPDVKVKLITDTTDKIQTHSLSEEEYEKILYWAERSGDKRTQLIIETLTGTGMRISELAFLTVESLNDRMFAVTNKGKTRYVFIPKRLTAKLKRYCKTNNIKSGIIFYGINPKTGEKKLLDQSRIRNQIKDIAGRARGTLRQRTHPHVFRHVFSRRYSETPGTNSFWLPVIMGHTTNITEDYAKGENSDYLKNVDMVEEYFYQKDENARRGRGRKKKRK